MKHSSFSFIFWFVFLCFLLSPISEPIGEWYLMLQKPSFTPPSWVFTPVWVFLFVLIGKVFDELWHERRKNALPLLLLTLQIGCIFIWPLLFFKLQRIDLALLDLTILWLLLIGTIASLRKRGALIFYLTPYFLWITFAFLINFEFYKLNLN